MVNANINYSKYPTFNEIFKCSLAGCNLVDLVAGLIFADQCAKSPGDIDRWLFNELGLLVELPETPTFLQDIYLAAAEASESELITACLLYRAAFLFDKNQNFESAHRYFQEALDTLDNLKTPVDADWMKKTKGQFYNTYAWSLYNSGKFMEGVVQAKKGLAFLPDYINLKGTLGNLLYHSSLKSEREHAFVLLQEFMSQGLDPHPNEILAKDPRYIVLFEKYIKKSGD